MAAAEHSLAPVPLYLIPVALSQEIKGRGGAINAIHITRTAGHTYAIKIATVGESGNE